MKAGWDTLLTLRNLAEAIPIISEKRLPNLTIFRPPPPPCLLILKSPPPYYLELESTTLTHLWKSFQQFPCQNISLHGHFDYCSLVWMLHNRGLNKQSIGNKIFGTSKLKLLTIEMFKVYNNMAPEILNDIFKQRTLQNKLWNHNSFVRCPVYSIFNVTETLSAQGPKIRDLITNETKLLDSLTSFKFKINLFLEISQNLHENICAWVSFLIKFQAWGLQLY